MNSTILTKKILFVFVICLFECLNAQTKENVDVKIENSKKLTAPEKREEYLKVLDEIVSESSKLEYSFGIAYGYYGKSRIALSSRDFSNSIRFAKLADKEDIENDHRLLKTKIYQILGINNNTIGYDEEALKYYKKMISSAKKLTDEKQSVYNENIAYNDLASLYGLKKKNMDSASYYMRKVYNNLSKFDNRDLAMNTLLGKASVALASYYDLIGKKDSSDFYLKKTQSQVPAKVPEDSKSINVHRHLSSIYLLQGKIAEAEKSNAIFLKKSQSIKSAELVKEAYKSKYLLSEKKGDLKKTNNDLKKYVRVSDSLNGIDDGKIKNAYNQIITDKERQIEDKKTHSKYLISVIIFIVLAVSYLSYYFKKKSDEKKSALKKKQLEISDLQGKVNTAFEEVILLAKTNSTSFLSRFREVYPEFCQKIISIFPTIQNTELELCAYIYLNFATKEIANFIFVTPKTIQMRKYRIRKKLNIPTDEDIYVWMKNL